MSDNTAAAQAADIEKARNEAVQAEVARRNAVVALFANHEGHDELREQCAADPKVDEAEASKRLLAAIAKDTTPTARVSIPKGGDNRDKFVAGVSNAVLARAGSEKLVAGNEFAGSGLSQIVAFCLERKGVANAHRMNRSQLATQILASQSSSDFPLLLADIATKLLKRAYDEAPTTWRAWCGTLDVPDFKTVKNLQLGTFNSLATIGEHGEYTYGSVGEDGESITAATKGKAIMMTRQMLINDDLGAFNRMAKALGNAAARTINEDVYAFLAANAATRDTGALFNNTAVTTAGGHANLGTAAAITVASLAEAEKLMALQKDVGLRTTLNLSPKFLLAPRGKRQIAWEILNSTSDPASSNSAKRNYAAQLGLELISDAQLDAASATAWYIACDPSVASLVDVAFLDGVQTPYTDENVDWETDAMKLKVRIDYGVGPGDWRAGVKNAGA